MNHEPSSSLVMPNPPWRVRHLRVTAYKIFSDNYDSAMNYEQLTMNAEL